MKPKNNLIFCIGCQKNKMLFESQSKADNFIKFNSDEILRENKKAPVRSYYCKLCFGWHVTSNPSAVEGIRFDDRDEVLNNRLNQFMLNDQNKGVLSAVQQSINTKLVEFETYLHMGEFDEAENVLEICFIEINDARLLAIPLNKVDRLKERIQKARKLLDKYYDLINTSKEKQDEILNNPFTSKLEIKIIRDIRYFNQIKLVFDNCDLLVNSDNKSLVNEIIDKCKEYINSLSGGVGAKKAKSLLCLKLDNILSDRKKRIRNETNASPKIDKVIDERRTVKNKSNIEKYYSSEYKANMLDLIKDIEKIESKFDEEKFDECKDIIELSFLRLADIKNDNNTIIIKKHLDYWNHKLKSL